VDPFTAASLRRSLPLVYDEMLGAEPANAKQRALMGDMRETGVRSGHVIPLHAPTAEAGIVYLGSRLSPPEFARLDREVRPLAALLSAHFHEHMKPVVSLSEGASAGERRERPAAPSPVGSPRLTARERECLL
jgi:hypothetical protein